MSQRQDADALLSVHGVSRRFGDVAALENISLSIRSGEVLCLVGQSGCGKSSLLRIIAGVDEPDEGRIILDGAEIAGPGSHVEPEARRIGLIFQDYALFPHLDVRDNIQFGLRKLSRADAFARGDEMIERFDLQNLTHRFPHMLSGGEHQRVALARALAPAPHVLLMDEPFSNLDRKLRDGVRDETLTLLRSLGTTVVMVTHDPEEALSAGDRIALMRAGRLVQTGSGRDLYEYPACAYVAEFFCNFNKIAGFCRNGFIETPLGRFPAPGRTDGSKSALYIRPQSLRIAEKEGVAARIVDRVLLGEIEQIKIAIPEISHPLRLRSTERHELSSGDAVFVSVDPKGTFVFDWNE